MKQAAQRPWGPEWKPTHLTLTLALVAPNSQDSKRATLAEATKVWFLLPVISSL